MNKLEGDEEKKFIKYLESENHMCIKYIDGVGYCSLFRFVFTTAIVYGLNYGGYSGRYCFPINIDAVSTFKKWDGVGHPKGNWIKHKGWGVDDTNPNYKK